MSFSLNQVQPSDAVFRSHGAPRLEGPPVQLQPRAALDRVTISVRSSSSGEASEVDRRLVELSQTVRDAQKGAVISAGAAMTSGRIGEVVRRIQNLAVEAAKQPMPPEGHVDLARELRRLQREVDEIADKSRAGGASLAGPSASSVALELGRDEEDTLIIPLQSLETRSGLLAPLGAAIGRFDALAMAGADESEQQTALRELNDHATRAETTLHRHGEALLALQERFEGYLAVGQVAADNLMAERGWGVSAFDSGMPSNAIVDQLDAAPELGFAVHGEVSRDLAMRLLDD